MVNPTLYENEQIKLEQRAQEGENSYHLAIFQSEYGSLYVSRFEGKLDGRDINPGDEVHAPVGCPLCRLYQGLNIPVAYKVSKLVSKATETFRGTISANTIIKYVDKLLVKPAETGIELGLVEDHNFLYDHAWKRLQGGK
jgi:hypothetical protein